jgi:hypothetical protein
MTRTDVALDSAALQALVAAEDAAVFGLSAAGGRLNDLAPGGVAATVVAATYDVHRLRRDAWSAALRALKAPVPAAAPAYALPSLSTVAEATDVAAGLEERCGQAYDAALAGLTNRTVRAQVIAALTDAARLARTLLLTVGASAEQASTAFPGQP